MAKNGNGKIKGKRGGRIAGVPNKVTGALRQAILQAAEGVGLDGRGKDGLVGYLRRLAIFEPVAYAGLLRAILPHQIKIEANRPLVHQQVQCILVRPDGQQELLPTVPQLRRPEPVARRRPITLEAKAVETEDADAT